MPTWSSAEAFAADIERFQRELEREVARAAGTDMAKRAQRIAERAASRDLGGDPKFSGWSPTLDTQVKPLTAGALLLPTRSSAGPWTVAQEGRNNGNVRGGAFLGPGATRSGGAIRRRKDGSIARVRGRQGKRWNGTTRGKNTASDAYAEMERELGPLAEKHVRGALVKRFDVS